MVELIIAEKPDAAKNIAQALADNSPKKSSLNGVPYHELTHNNKKILVCSAVGHLYTVAPKKKSWNYPQFDILWKPTAEVDKSAAFTKKYLTALIKLVAEADEFTVATDYDIEGEVIGFNVVKYICKKKDANRMKFSTLTKSDLIEAYQNKQKTLDWGQVKAGTTRHELDWYYGINLSSALTSAIKSAGAFKILSSGRVQGPALKMLCDREHEIQAFKPEPYWQIQLLGKVKQSNVEAWHVDDKILDEKKADSIMNNTKGPKGKEGFVKKKEFSEVKQPPPFPFDLTSFQIECHRVHRITPKDALAVAQELYISGIISYPRTSSQKLPAKIGYTKILNALKKQDNYKELAEKLTAKKFLKPNEGKKTDDAHPAIYPTGHLPKNLNSRAQKVYDLIVRRFLATFADWALRESVKATIDVNKEDFIAKGITTKTKGWHEFYGPYANFDEVVLPEMDEGDKVAVKSIKKLQKETKPPKRYTQASIIKELDKRNLGTKATRAHIIDNLYARGYVNNKSMEVTDLGLKTCDILAKYSPTILDENLTRQFEEELEEIRHKEKTPDQILKRAEDVLTDLLTDFKSKEKQIGQELKKAEYEDFEAQTTIGKCPKCGKGTLKIKKSKFGKFIACDAYPKCKTTMPMPKFAKVKPSEEMCKDCKYPMINVQQARRKPENICVNPDCPSKKVKDENGHKIRHFPEEGMQCPECKEGKMVLRKSFYGTFLGCDNYPKCKTMMKIVDGKVDTTPITHNGNGHSNGNSKNNKNSNSKNAKKTTAKKSSVAKKKTSKKN